MAEICQIRTADVALVGSVWALKFDAEAGPLKNANAERVLPIHPGLIKSGFIDFVKMLPAGPVFPALPLDKFKSRGGNGTKVLGRWVRSLGITDETISPSHSWRHRFRTVARRNNLSQEIVNAMLGHGARNIGEAYGEYELISMLREIEKIPCPVYGRAD